MSSYERDDDEAVTDGDDDERQHTDEHERQPRSHLLLEVRVRLRSAADAHAAARPHLDAACPEHVQVLADGQRDDGGADGDGAARRTHLVLD